MKTITPFFLFILMTLLPGLVSAQIQYLSTIPPYNGGNGSSMIAFNVKAKNAQIEIKELYCTFSSTASQTTTIYYKIDSINGSPTVTTWTVAGTVTHSPTISGVGTMSLIPVPNLSIMIPAGAVYGIAISGANITYTGTGSAPTSPWVIDDANIYINMGTAVGWGGTATSPIQYRQFNGKIGYQLANQKTDAGLTAMGFPPDTICSGNQSVGVTLKNFGPKPLTNVKIGCNINQDSLPTYNWTGNLAVNATAYVPLGSYNFVNGNSYSISAFTKLPNNLPDTFTSNDTIHKPSLMVMPAFLGTISPSTTVNFCTYDSVQVSLNSPTATSWQWYFNGQIIPGANTSSYYIKQAGPYHVWFSNGICSRSSDTIIATAVPAPPAVLTTYTPTTFCYGDSVYLFANTGSGLTYEWKLNNVTIPGATASTYAAKSSGSYKVVVSIPGSCSTNSNVVNVVVKPVHPVNLGPDTTVCGNAVVSLNAGSGASSYLWSTGAQTQTINVDSTGVSYGSKTISVITTKDSCESSDAIIITFIDCTGIDRFEKENTLNIIPNPNTGEFIISNHGFAGKHLDITITDLQGRTVYSEFLSDFNSSQPIKLNTTLSQGVYTLRLSNETKSLSSKLIINN